MAEGQSADDKPVDDDKPDEPAEDAAEETSEDAAAESADETGADSEGEGETETETETEAEIEAAVTSEPEPAPAAAAAGGSGGSTPLVPVAIAAAVALVVGAVIGFVVGNSGDDDNDDTEIAAGDGGDEGAAGDHDHDHDHGDRGEGPEHEGHEMGDFEGLLDDFPDAEETGLAALLEDHHWHGEDNTEDLDGDDRELLDLQLELVGEMAEEYPTPADAEEEFRRAGPFIPGLGTHYILRDSDDTMFIPDTLEDEEDEGTEVRPVLIYNGDEDDSALAGFMFLSLGAEDNPDGGFVGAEGAWHQHTDMCIVQDEETDELDFPFVADQSNITEDDCEAVDGFMHEISSYMIHVWSIDGWESDLGLYSEVNPALTCEDGTYQRVPYDELEAPFLTTCVDGSMA